MRGLVGPGAYPFCERVRDTTKKRAILVSRDLFLCALLYYSPSASDLGSQTT